MTPLHPSWITEETEKFNPSLQDKINCKQQALAFLKSAGGSKNAKTVSRLQSELDDLRKEMG